MGLRLVKIKTKYLLLIAISITVLVLDQWTKWQVVSHFRYGETMEVIPGFFNLTYVRNTGAAFGILASSDPSFRVPFFLIVPVIALLAIGYLFRRISDQDHKMAVALSLVIGGAIGNLIDRAMLGYVIDFLDFYLGVYHFPAFNIADSAICVGVGLLMFDLVVRPESSIHQEAGNASPSS